MIAAPLPPAAVGIHLPVKVDPDRARGDPRPLDALRQFGKQRRDRGQPGALVNLMIAEGKLAADIEGREPAAPQDHIRHHDRVRFRSEAGATH